MDTPGQKKCFLCEYVSNGNSDLQKHLKSHESTNGERDYRHTIVLREGYDGSAVENTVDVEDSLSNDTGPRRSCLTGATTHRRNQLSVDVPKLKCSSCEYVTYKKFNLMRHLETHKYGEGRFKCHRCNYSTSDPSNLVRHKKSHENEHRLVHNPRKEHHCLLCGQLGASRKDMMNHFVSAHEISMKETCLNFNDFEDFLEWKDTFEKASVSRFVKFKKATSTRSKTVHLYRCHRDGVFVSESKGIRHLKSLGSNKINSCCPAEIKATVDKLSSVVDVKVVETHVGHSNDVGRLSLTMKEKESLAEQIASKVDMKVILDDMREDLISGGLSRRNLVTRKDLFNIAQKFNLRSCAVDDRNDWTSVDSWVKENMDTVVRFYKPQGVLLDSHPQLAAEDFILVIANDPQIVILEQYGNDCVCLEGTHGVNQNDFEVTTLLVVDDLRQGFPCCFMLSNKSDSSFVTIMLQAIKEALGFPLSPLVFTSDVSEVYIDAWNAVMFPPENRLYCSWHVDRAWKKNLSSKVKGRETQKQIYKTIRTLLQSDDEPSFPQLLQSALASFESEPDTAEFGKYFRNEYGSNYRLWAYCYRSYPWLNTNMHLECMDKVLKHYHFQGKKVKRLDLCVDGLMKFTRDKLYGRLIAICRRKVSFNVSASRFRHKKAQEMNNVTVLKTTESSWCISSRSSLTTHDIAVCDLDCSCDFKCDECKVCIHSYTCSCNDSAIRWNICSHVHYLVMVMSRIGSDVETDQAGDENSTEEFVIVETNSRDCIKQEVIAQDFSEPEDSCASFEDAKKNVMREAQKVVDQATNMQHLNIILNGLAPIISAIEASNEVRERL